MSQSCPKRKILCCMKTLQEIIYLNSRSFFTFVITYLHSSRNQCAGALSISILEYHLFSWNDFVRLHTVANYSCQKSQFIPCSLQEGTVTYWNIKQIICYFCIHKFSLCSLLLVWLIDYSQSNRIASGKTFKPQTSMLYKESMCSYFHTFTRNRGNNVVCNYLENQWDNR